MAAGLMIARVPSPVEPLLVNGLLDWLDDPRPDGGVRIATAGGDWKYTSYPELARNARRVAAHLTQLGASRGDVVSLVISRPDEFMTAFFGALAAGCTASPIATPLSLGSQRESYVEHMARIIRTAAPSVVLTDESHRTMTVSACALAAVGAPVVATPLDAIAEADAAGPLAEIAVLQFTSGSTGTPKGVQVTPENLVSNASGIRKWLGLTSEDSVATWLPLYHDMGLIGTMVTPVTSCTDIWVMSPVQFLRSPERWVECYGRGHATIATAPTFGYAYAARRIQEKHLEGMDFSGWRVAICGAERIDPSALHGFSARLRPHGFDPSAFVGAYGLAEGTLAVTGVRPKGGTTVIRVADRSVDFGDDVVVTDQRRLGEHDPSSDDPYESGWLASCGTPLQGTTVTVVDESGRPLGPGRVGEIRVSGPGLARGYRTAGDEDVTFDRDGWRTGDMGFLLDEELYVVGRTGDSLKVRGKRVFAEDIEGRLLAVAGINPGSCAAVLGSFAGRDAAAVLVEGRGPEQLLDDAVALLVSAVGEGVPAAVLRGPRGSVLKTSSGKPRRRELWRQLSRAQGHWELLWESRASTDESPPWAQCRNASRPPAAVS